MNASECKRRRARSSAPLLGALLLLAACQQSPPEPAPMTTALPADTWFCAPDPENGEQPWKCIETTPIEAAKRAHETQLPAVAAPRTASARTNPARNQPAQAEPALPQPRPADEAASAEPRASEDDSPAGPTQPPETSRVRIQDLPPDYFTIQLIAVSDRARLQKFAEMHNLWGLTAARVKTDRGLYYVLLWGVYETRAQAREHLAKLPPSLGPDKVWIRPLGSLQAAMRAADEVTGTPQ